MASSTPVYNQNSASVRRLMQECKEMASDPSTLYTAAPLDDNLFEWHFTIRGPKDTEFEGGVYHGRILFPSDYPYRPPDIVFLTKNGRFELEKKICLTISSHHEETWRPSWSIRTVLMALITFLPTKGDGAIASLDWTPEERKKLATQSVTYKCDKCGVHNSTALRPEDETEKLNADDIPEELQLRDSKKDSASSSSAPSSSSAAPSSLSPPSSPYPTFSSPSTSSWSSQQRPEANQIPNTFEGPNDDEEVPNPDISPNTEFYAQENNNRAQQPELSEAEIAHLALEARKALLREKLGNVLSIIVLVIGLLLIYKLYHFL